MTAQSVYLSEIVHHKPQPVRIEPQPLDRDALIARIKQGGWSGDYLAHAFLSCYGMTPFKKSLHQLINLDTEGFNLFHQIIHMRHVPGWSDDELFSIACEINALQE